VIYLTKYYLVISSVTTAQRYNKILFEYRIKSSFVHTPLTISRGGCSYSIIIDSKNLTGALRAADECGIVVKAVYEKNKDEEFVKVEV